ncbi:MAG: 50S ribosomal protein L18 [Puniceicoccales bacterium]|jgi:large subunit ribosomal protein L18|nr:50S ribosomal protein L18 [Puniceicoccales bacterium]
MNFDRKKISKHRRRMRIRKAVLGTVSRPRLSLHFSGKHMYAQCVDDSAGRTLVYLSTVSKAPAEKLKMNVDGAASFGKLFSKIALDSGIGNVVFDRDTKRYHGRVKAFADSVRDAGLRF